VDLNWTDNGQPDYTIDGKTSPIVGPKGFVVGWWTSGTLTVDGNTYNVVSGFGSTPSSSISDMLTKLMYGFPKH
jgi:hypothetical protein